MKRSCRFMVAALIASTVIPAPSFACRYPTLPRAQVEQNYRSAFAAVQDVVEIDTVAAATETSGGSVRVRRMFKGGLRVGAVIEFSNAGIVTTCDPAPLANDARGIIFLRRGETRFPGFLKPDTESFLRQNGLVGGH